MSDTTVIDRPMKQVAPVTNTDKSINPNSTFNHSSETLTLTDVKCLVNRALSDTAEVITYSLKPYSSERVGFLASHQCLKVIVRIKSSKLFESVYFFVKAIPYNITAQTDHIREKGVFTQEAMFFDQVAPQLYGSKFLCDAWGPRCYLIKDDVLVFEELRVKGFSIREKLFDEELTAAGLAAIARLHAASLVAEAHLGKPLDTIYSHVFDERTFCRMGCQNRTYKAAIDVIVAVTEQLGLDARSIPTVCKCIFDAVKPSRSVCNVICHGDLWTNNFMFDNSVPPKCILVDFQLTRYCSPANDVAQLLYLTTTRKFRETRENAMIKHYYSVLCETLRATDPQVEPLLWTDLVRGVEEQRLCAVVIAAMFLPLVLMDDTLCSKIMKDSVNYENFMYNNRRDIVLSNMKRDIEYATRIKEVVLELHELSLRLESLPQPS